MTDLRAKPRLLNALIVASALLAIAAAPWAFDQNALVFVFKPLTTVLILVRAWPRGADAPAARRALRIGLLLSLLGDIRCCGHTRFPAGAGGVFVGSHRLPRGLHAPASSSRAAGGADELCAGGRRDPGAVVAVDSAWAAPAGGVLRARAHRDVGADAWGRWWAWLRTVRIDQRGRLLMLGGALFMASDALLATNKFAFPLPVANLWILGTYWAAQWCIASWLKPATASAAAATPGMT